MYEFGSDEYWEQEQLAQYERELYEQQCREQEEQEYIQFCQHCHHIAEGWLLGDLSDAEAIESLMYAGEEPTEPNLLEWAERVLSNE